MYTEVRQLSELEALLRKQDNKLINRCKIKLNIGSYLCYLLFAFAGGPYIGKKRPEVLGQVPYNRPRAQVPPLSSYAD